MAQPGCFAADSEEQCSSKSSRSIDGISFCRFSLIFIPAFDVADGAVSGSLLSFSDVEGSEFDSVFVDNSTGEVVYSNSVSIDGDSIYLDSAAAEKIVASNVELEFLSSENIVETKELVASNSEYNDFD